MERIIDPISVDLLVKELTPDKKLRNTNKGHNELYTVTAHDSPNVMLEIGRIREICFREGGACSGKSADIDDFDTMENPYHQLVVWDPDSKAILGGYRYILGPDIKINEDGQPHLATSHLFKFSEEFIEMYLPHTMELGRSFVAPQYQSSKSADKIKGIFAMDNLWDGIAAITLSHPNIMYYFGKVTMYQAYNANARNLILHFLEKHFKDNEKLVYPIKPFINPADGALMDIILKNDDINEDYKNLKEAVKKFGENIPPLVNSYMKTSPSMKVFSTTIDPSFGNSIETGILVCYDEMYPEKIARHSDSYKKAQIERFKERFPYLEPGFDEKINTRWNSRRKKIYDNFMNLLDKRRRNKKKK